MAFQQSNADFKRLTPAQIDVWRAVPPAVASDCMNRTQVMRSYMRPLSPDTILCGQARTVAAMVGDCTPINAQIAQVMPGEVIVVDAGGVEDVAVWGGVMATEAAMRKLGGGVIDGAIRDAADIRKLGFAMYCKAITPRGPHTGFGGSIDCRVSVAGVSVGPGDIVLGDEDGVVVVPLDEADRVLAAAQAHLLKEADWLRQLQDGISIAEAHSRPSVR